MLSITSSQECSIVQLVIPIVEFISLKVLILQTKYTLMERPLPSVLRISTLVVNCVLIVKC